MSSLWLCDVWGHQRLQRELAPRHQLPSSTAGADDRADPSRRLDESVIASINDLVLGGGEHEDVDPTDELGRRIDGCGGIGPSAADVR